MLIMRVGTIYDWTGAKNPSPGWLNPGAPSSVSPDFGVYWDIALANAASELFFIVRNAHYTGQAAISSG
jgi:hypothetical protein